MARKKTEPKPATKPKSPNETPTIPFRLTPDDLAAIDKIVGRQPDRKSTRLNSSHSDRSRMPSSA